MLTWAMPLTSITYPGHGMAEGVKPALVDSLAQALGVAPLFAFYEGLWFAGFAPDLKVGACRATPQNCQLLSYDSL